MRPEDALILACLAGQSKLPSTPFDEAALCHRAAYHRVTSTVYQHLQHYDCLSAATMAQLKTSYQANIGRNLALGHLLTTLTDILRSAGIDLMVLKGGLLIQSFPDYALSRRMIDLDILVRRQDLYRAYRVLAEAQFQPLFAPPQAWLQPYYTFFLNAFPLLGKDFPDLLVELHWQLFIPSLHASRWDEADLWQRAIQAPAGYYQPDPGDALLHAVAHQCADLKIYLSGLVDLAWMIEHWGDQLDWPAIRDRAAQRRILLHLVNMLRISHELLNVPLPEGYDRLFQPLEAEARPGYELLLTRLFNQEYTENFSETLILLKTFRRLEGLSPQAKFWFEYMAPTLAALGRPLKGWLKSQGWMKEL